MRRTGIALVSTLALAFTYASVAGYAQWYRGDVKAILRNLEEDTDHFTKSLDSDLDHSPLNGTHAEDEINRYVHDFEEATDRLKDRYDDRSYAPGQTREVMVRAQRIDRFMRGNRFGGKSHTDWARVRSDLDQLARAYSVGWRW